MGVPDTTEKDWEEHYKEYLANVTEEYKIGYNKAIDDFILSCVTTGIIGLSTYHDMNILAEELKEGGKNCQTKGL